MGLAVYLALVLPALFAPFAGPLAARLHPVYATWLLTGAAVVLAGCSTLALALLAAAAAVRLPLVAGLGHWSLLVLGHNTPPALAVALLAGILLGVAALTVSGFAIRRYRALAGAYREARCLPGRGQTVVVADKAADAYALPGRPGRIVVTAGCYPRWMSGGGPRCSRTSGRTWPGSITCSRVLCGWQPPRIRCCVLRRGRLSTRWNAGRTSAPPSWSGTGVWSRTRSGGQRWPPRQTGPAA